MKVYIIAISGKMFSGKTTFKNLLIEHFGKISPKLIVVHKALATPLKNCLKTLNIKNERKDKRIRLFLQSLGDLTRNIFGSDFFIRYLIDEILYETKHIKKAIVYIIDDLRFIEEYDLLKRLVHEHKDINVFFVRIEATIENRKQRAIKQETNLYNNEHRSEIDLDHITDWDLIVDNNSTIKSMYDNYVIQVAEHITKLF